MRKCSFTRILSSTVLLMMSVLNMALAGGESSRETLQHVLASSNKVTADISPNPFCGIAQAASPEGPMLLLNQPNNRFFQEAFSFARTLENIVETSDSTRTSQPQLIRSLLDGFGLDSAINPISKEVMPLDVRLGELGLDAKSLITDMKPTAVFNRLDLAAVDGSHCGEQRIVYHLDAENAQNAFGRLFLIFEAQYPNPSPEEGVNGCQPIAEFWAQLTELRSEQARLEAVAKFFYKGIQNTHTGNSLPPVVDFANYQTGQVRTNHFINRDKWQLREFRAALNDEGQAVFRVDTVKHNPLAELYSGSWNNKAFIAEFNADFSRAIEQLMAPELTGTVKPSDIINGVSLQTSDRFNEFQSDAEFESDDLHPSTRLQDIIEQRLDELELPLEINTAMVINRAHSQTCGGCHERAGDKLIAPNLSWPRSAGFVHVDESGGLSPALTDFFLPNRKHALAEYICSLPTTPIPKTVLQGKNRSKAGVVKLTWEGKPSLIPYTYALKRGATTVANRDQWNSSTRHQVFLGVEPVGSQSYHLEACRGSKCEVVSAVKRVNVKRFQPPVPETPKASGKFFIQGDYEISFSNTPSLMNRVTLLENGNPVASHTISGGDKKVVWNQVFKVDHSDKPGLYRYQVQSCNGGNCALSRAIHVYALPLPFL